MTDFIGSGSTGAIFSDCRKYRYSLWRRWKLPELASGNSDLCCFIGLNPSTADETVDDPTIRRCIGFAKDWGFNGLVMLNIFAYRATDPTVMKDQPDPVGDHNNEAIAEVTARVGKTVAAWGVHGQFRDRDAVVMRLIHNLDFYCLGLTKDGHPKHPLYLPKNSAPMRF